MTKTLDKGLRYHQGSETESPTVMKRRTFLAYSMSTLLPCAVFADDDLPPLRPIGDPEGESTLLPAIGPGPLVYMSHRLGGVPAKGRQRAAPWVMFGAMRRAGWHLLRSADAGPDTYGNDRALSYCTRICGKALEQLDWNGRLFSLGISMGSLTALQMTWKDLFPHPVDAVATIDGAMDLRAIHARPPERRRRIESAYGTNTRGFIEASRGHGPMNDFQAYSNNGIPLLAFASTNDTVLPIRRHSAPMVRASRDVGAPSKLVRTSGAHLANAHFSAGIASRIIDFFSKNAR